MIFPLQAFVRRWLKDDGANVRRARNVFVKPASPALSFAIGDRVILSNGMYGTVTAIYPYATRSCHPCGRYQGYMREGPAVYNLCLGCWGDGTEGAGMWSHQGSYEVTVESDWRGVPCAGRFWPEQLIRPSAESAASEGRSK